MELLTRLKAAYNGFKNPDDYIREPEGSSSINLDILKPCMRFIGNSIEEQTAHINEEVFEVVEALFYDDYNHALEETIDTIQSCITALEIYRRQGFDVQTAIETVFMKNNMPGRNYYCEQPTEISNPDLYICGKCNNVVCVHNWRAVAGKV